MSLISEIRQDLDASALQLITEYRDRLFAEAVRLSADVSAAEDLVSRTLDKAIRNLESHHKDESVFGWMKAIMLNLHRNDMRSPVRRGTAPVDPSVLEEYSEADWTTDEEILKRSDSQALREAIGRLDPEFKKTMVLHYLSELPVKQIAVVMNVPVGTVLWRLNIARKILARDLGGKLGKKPVAVLLAVLLGVGSLFGAWKVAEAIWPNDLTEKKEAETDMNANVMKSGAAAVLAAVGLSGAPMAVSAAVPPAYAGEAGCICYVNPKTGNDQTAVKNSTDLKFQTIQAAIDACDENGIVRLDDGTYEISAEIGLNKGIALVGNGWDKCVIKRIANYCRVVKMDSSSPSLYGVTVTGGNTYTDSWEAGSGAGVYMESGTVSWCCISNNLASPFGNNVSGGGVCIESGTIDHSIIVDNKAATSNSGRGGGIGSSNKTCGEIVIDTCLVYGNKSYKWSGGGIYAGAAGMKIRNTTVAKNTGENSKGGGIYFDNADVTVENCIFADNIAPNDATVFGGVPNWSAKDQTVVDGVASRSSASLFGSPATVALGQGSTVGSAHFKSRSAFDFHLEANSDANGLGVWYDGIANDLEDKPRKDVPAAGCYESDSSADPFSCLVNSFAATAFTDELVAFSATPVNPPVGVEIVYTWYLTNQFGHVETFGGNPASVTLAPGTYSVAVRASAGGVDSELGVSEEKIQVAVRTNFVTSVENPDAAFPYDTPKTATDSLQEVIATAIGGTTIILDGGEHVVTSQIVLDKGVTIIGAGRDLTTVRRGAGKFQMLYLNHANANVRNLTLSGAWYDERWAMGAAVVFGTLGGFGCCRNWARRHERHVPQCR